MKITSLAEFAATSTFLLMSEAKPTVYNETEPNNSLATADLIPALQNGDRIRGMVSTSSPDSYEEDHFLIAASPIFGAVRKHTLVTSGPGNTYSMLQNFSGGIRSPGDVVAEWYTIGTVDPIAFVASARNDSNGFPSFDAPSTDGYDLIYQGTAIAPTTFGTFNEGAFRLIRGPSAWGK